MSGGGTLVVTRELLEGGAGGADEAQAAEAEAAQALVEVDAGNLLASDPAPVDARLFSDPESAARACEQLGARALQALFTTLVDLPSRRDDKGDGRLVLLPPPVTVLPRHKPVPLERAQTRWEKFAETKGIRKRKRSKLVWDEVNGEWRRRHGYGRANEESDVPIVEARAGEDPSVDPWTRMRDEKKARVSANEKRRMRNVKENLKERGISAASVGAAGGGGAGRLDEIPAGLSSSATLAFEKGMKGQGIAAPRNKSKNNLLLAAATAASATASMGKFDANSSLERKDSKYAQKRHAKRLPVVGAGEAEAKLLGKVMARVVDAREREGFVNIDKAARHFQAQEDAAIHAARKADGLTNRQRRKGLAAGEDDRSKKKRAKVGGLASKKGKAGKGKGKR